MSADDDSSGAVFFLLLAFSLGLISGLGIRGCVEAQPNVAKCVESGGHPCKCEDALGSSDDAAACWRNIIEEGGNP